MRPKDAAIILEQMVLNYRPVLLVGPPGIGKTSLVDQVREKTGADILVSHPVVNDPTDAKGMPAIVDGKARFLPFGDLQSVLDYEGKLLIWDLEDLGQALPATQAGYMQLLLSRRINGNRIPDTVVFVSTTNRKEDRAGVSGILEPVKSRFHMIIELEANAEDLILWGLVSRRIRKEIIACLRLYPELVMGEGSREIKPTNCPRTWEFASQTLDLNLPSELLFPALCCVVGEGPGAQLHGMLTVFKDLPTVASIVKRPTEANLPDNPSSFHALCTVLSKHLEKKPKDVDSVFRYADRMPGDFSVCLVRDSLTITPELADTKAFQVWNANNVDLFI